VFSINKSDSIFPDYAHLEHQRWIQTPQLGLLDKNITKISLQKHPQVYLIKNRHPNKHFPHYSKIFPQKGEQTFFVRIEEFGAETQGPGHKNSWPLGNYRNFPKKVRIENGGVWIQYKRASFMT